MVNAGAIVISSLIKVNKQKKKLIFLGKFKKKYFLVNFLVSSGFVLTVFACLSDNQLCTTPKQTLIYAHVLACRQGQE